jgi:hypothetical protein
LLERRVVALCRAADDERDRDRLLQVEQHALNDRGELVAGHAVDRLAVPRLHELAELALPVRERLPAGEV